MMVGRTMILLLDSNLEENQPDDRELTQKLYQGGLEARLCQEWILGVGGVRVLRALGIEPGAWQEAWAAQKEKTVEKDVTS